MLFVLRGYVNALTETKSHMLLVAMVTVNGVTLSQKHVEDRDEVKSGSCGKLIIVKMEHV